MSIHVGDLLPENYRALERFCEERQWSPLQTYMEPETVAWLATKLKFIADNYAIFPHGKWTLIHRLQDMVDNAARKEAFPYD